MTAIRHITDVLSDASHRRLRPICCLREATLGGGSTLEPDIELLRQRRSAEGRSTLPPNRIADLQVDCRWQKIGPAMKPQSGTHYEAGIRYLFKDWIEGNLTLFWIDLKNEIFYNPDTFTNENFPKTRRQGIEIGTKLKPFPWLLVWGNYSYTKPTLRAEPFSGNDIPGVPRNKASLGTEINLGRGFLLQARTNIVGIHLFGSRGQHFISDWANQVDKLDAYYTLDAKLSYSWKGLNAFVGVNNITNQKYAEYGVLNFLKQPNYYPSPERNFFGGISYTF